MTYAAHVSQDGREQTVPEHCRTVAELCSEYCEPFGLSATGRLAGLQHDLGKLTPDFNGYVHGNDRFRRGELDHSYAGARYLTELAADGDKYQRLAARLISDVIISHHGLHDWIDQDGSDYFKKRTAKTERWEEICRNAPLVASREEIKELLEKAGNELRELLGRLGGKNAVENRFYMGMTERLLESCLVDADRTDAADFESGRKTVEPETDKLWNEMKLRMDSRLAGFPEGGRISELRRDISDRCSEFADHRTGAVRLVVPTGGGKTLASLRFAIDYCLNQQGMKKIIYTAPFMSILEQNSDELRAIAGDESFLEHYSDIFAELDTAEELAEQELKCERWTDPVIATTMVQLLNSLFSGKMASLRRFHRLGRAVLIIDEIQSLPLKCVYLFDLAVNFMTTVMGTAAVLCSATQPPLENLAHPLRLDDRQSMTGDYSGDFAAFRRTKAVALLRNRGYSYDEAAAFCMEKYRENGDMLLVVNTKKAAAELFRRLSELNSTEDEPAELIHISTRLCPQHRRALIERMRSLLREKRRVVCVATQLIEAGVDVSFRCVVRSLAGLDNAAQAAGRCNRSGDSGCREVYVVELGEEKLDKLPEIMRAQEVSRNVILHGGFDDFLSVEALSEYFREYYEENRGVLYYPCRDGQQSDSSLLDMLSQNKGRGNPPGNLLGQAFASAGRIFEVIDSDTRGVLVPYNDEARELITALNGVTAPDVARQLQRRAQKYSVGVYPWEEAALEKECGLIRLASGALAVEEGFYDGQLGLVLRGSASDVIY